MEKGDKGSTLIRMGVSGWMFLLVPAYPGCPGSKAIKWSLLLLLYGNCMYENFHCTFPECTVSLRSTVSVQSTVDPVRRVLSATAWLVFGLRPLDHITPAPKQQTGCTSNTVSDTDCVCLCTWCTSTKCHIILATNVKSWVFMLKHYINCVLLLLLLLLLLLFWPSVDMFPMEFKNWDIQNWVRIYQSVQSEVGKLSCNKTALKRCTSTETLWNKKAPSPEDEEIFLPKLPKSWHADVFKGPKVSTAIGAKRYWLPMLAYFSSLWESVSSAAAPASRADPVT